MWYIPYCDVEDCDEYRKNPKEEDEWCVLGWTGKTCPNTGYTCPLKEE